MNHNKLKSIEKIYETTLNKANVYFKANDIDSCLNSLELAATIAWICPFKPLFGDDLIENILLKISNNLNFKKYQESNRILLYCTSTRDFGALVQQYLYNLPNVTLIVHEQVSEYENFEILNYLKNEQIEFHILEKKRPFIDKIKSLEYLIQKIKPIKIFLHLDPNDVFAATYFIKLKKLTYFINHGDHLFWIGRNSFQNIIEFRSYGFWFSKNIRKLKNVKYYVIPFYPILPKNKFDTNLNFNEGSIIGVSGGNLYKYNQDPDLIFFKIIIRLLKKNKNFFFILCGKGNSKRIEKLVRKENIGDRFKIYGFRRDFSEIIKKSHIYFNSYPVGGGLSLMYALYHKVPIVSVIEKVRNGDSLEEVFEIPTYKSLESIGDMEEFANQLINYKLFRQNIINSQLSKTFNINKFKELLTEIIEDKAITKKTVISEHYTFDFDLNLKNSINENGTFNNVIYWAFIFNIKNAGFYKRVLEYLNTIKSLKKPDLRLILKIHIIFFGLRKFIVQIRNDK
jgi:hypothetical protein